jgi:lipopolysaccharide/colanic/teichoic acid biosynthesis glycosyltransferase
VTRIRPRRLLLVGDDCSARRLRESFQQSAPRHWQWVGVVTDSPPDADLGPLLGASGELRDIVSRERPTDVVVALDHPGLTLARTLLQLTEAGVRLVGAHALHEEMTRRVALLGEREPWATAFCRLSYRRPFFHAVKRTLDLIAALFAVAALAVVILPVTLVLVLEGAGSVFVAERRVGFLGRRFTLLRFRTTRDVRGGLHWPLTDPPAPTRSGSYFRRFGLDRLPQALAILAGHLSLVGPRAPDYEAQQRFEQESPVFLVRTLVKPGLTGWEQLHRESRSIYDALRPLEYDVYYIKHQSLGLDLRILARTALALAGIRA